MFSSYVNQARPRGHYNAQKRHLKKRLECVCVEWRGLNLSPPHVQMCVCVFGPPPVFAFQTTKQNQQQQLYATTSCFFSKADLSQSIIRRILLVRSYFAPASISDTKHTYIKDLFASPLLKLAPHPTYHAHTSNQYIVILLLGLQEVAIPQKSNLPPNVDSRGKESFLFVFAPLDRLVKSLLSFRPTNRALATPRIEIKICVRECDE